VFDRTKTRGMGPLERMRAHVQGDREEQRLIPWQRSLFQLRMVIHMVKWTVPRFYLTRMIITQAEWAHIALILCYYDCLWICFNIIFHWCLECSPSYPDLPCGPPTSYLMEAAHCTDYWQALPEFSLLSTWIKFWFVTAVSKYLKCDTFLAIFIPRFWPAFWWQHILSFLQTSKGKASKGSNCS
jgi:hypothetical protein